MNESLLIIIVLCIQKYCNLALWSRTSLGLGHLNSMALNLEFVPVQIRHWGGYFLAVVIVSHPPLLLKEC